MKKKGCLIIFLIGAAFSAFVVVSIIRGLSPWNLADKDPQKMFEVFVCKPVVPSISDIKADGVIAFAGGHAMISFSIDPKDIDMLIERGGFKLASDKSPNWILEYSMTSGEKIEYRYVQQSEGTEESALFVSPDRDRCWYYQIQY